MKTIICKNCGKEIEVKTKRFKYCDICREIRLKEIQKKANKKYNEKYKLERKYLNKIYSQNNKEKIKKYHSKYARSDKGKQAVKKYGEKAQEKVKARSKLEYAIRKCPTIKKPCIICGNKNSQGHHENYSRPLEVIWFCSKHHREFEFLKSLENYTGIEKECMLKTIDEEIIEYYTKVFPYIEKINCELALLY